MSRAITLIRNEVPIKLELYYTINRAEPDIGLLYPQAEITRVEAFDDTTGRWLPFDEDLTDEEMLFLTEILNDGDF